MSSKVGNLIKFDNSNNPVLDKLLVDRSSRKKRGYEYSFSMWLMIDEDTKFQKKGRTAIKGTYLV